MLENLTIRAPGEKVSENGVPESGIQKIGMPDTEGPDPLFTLDRLIVKYRFLPLIRRRLEVVAVVIEEPRLTWPRVNPFSSGVSAPERLSPNAGDSVLSGARSTVSATDTDVGAEPAGPLLPLSIGLFRLALNDFDFVITLPDSVRERIVGLENLYLEVSDLRLPRNPAAHPQDIRGRIRLRCPGGIFRWEEEDFAMRWHAEVGLEADFMAGAEWQVGLSLGMGSESASSGRVQFESRIEGKRFAEQVQLRRLRLSVGGVDLMTAEGSWEWTESVPELELSVSGEEVDVRELVEDLSGMLPDAWMSWMEHIVFEGFVRPLSASAAGPLDALRVECETEFHEGWIRMKETGLTVSDVSAVLRFAGIWTNFLEEGRIGGLAEIGGADLMTEDSVSLDLGDIRIEIDSRLDDLFFPHRGTLSVAVDSILSGSLRTDWEWNLREGEEALPQRIIGAGTLSSEPLDLAELDWMPEGYSGKVRIGLESRVDGLSSILTDWHVDTPGFIWSQNGRTDGTPPIRIDSRIALGVENMSNVSIDSLTIRLNDQVKARMQGTFDLAVNRFACRLECCVDNDGLASLAPLSLEEKFANLSISGQEQVSLTAEGRMLSDSMEVVLDGSLAIDDLGLEYPEALIRVEHMNALLSVTGKPSNLEGNVKIEADRFSLEQMRVRPIAGLFFEAGWKFMGFDRFHADCRIGVEGLGIEGPVSFDVQDLSGVPDLSADAALRFQTVDPIEWIDGLALSGSATCRLLGRVLDAENRRFRLAGALALDSLDLIREPMLRMTRLEGELPFELDMDGLKGELILHPEHRPPRWEAYAGRRIAYKHLTPALGTLRIASVDVSGYRVEDVLLDLYASHGFIHVPWFRMNLLEGNMGGSLLVELGTGDPEQIKYEIEAHLSRVNAASLIEGRADEKGQTELNATLAFTGRGVDPTGGMDLDGAFHITKIGPEFASTLLSAMDPTGSDRSIRLTRKLLNTGWKPKLFSFELRHGYVYPSLALSQPWFSPIRIPGQLEYGRLPLAFFLRPQNGE